MFWLTKLKMKLGSAEKRIQTIKSMAASGDPRAVPELMVALKDKDGAVPLAAAEALGNIGDIRAIPALAEAMHDKEEYISQAAAEALGKFGEQAVEPLVKALADTNPHLRQLAVKTLGQIGAAAMEPLSKMMESPFMLLRMTAAEALAHIPSTATAELLVVALADQDHQVREKAERSLIVLGKIAVPHLVPVLLDKQEVVWKSATHILDKVAWEPLNQDNPEKRVLDYCKWADLPEEHPEILKGLAAVLRHDEKGVQLAAGKLLANIGGPAAVPLLVLALDSPQRFVRDTAVETLLRTGSSAVENLIEAAQEGPPEVRQVVAWILGEIGDERAGEPLTRLFKDPDAKFRGTVIEALGKLKDEGTVPLLRTALQDSESLVRVNAIEALWQIGTPEALASLLDALRIDDPKAQIRAAQALGQVRDERAIEPLLEAFQRSEAVRVAAALALSKIAPARAVGPLASVAAADLAVTEQVTDVLTDILRHDAQAASVDDLRAVARLKESVKASAADPAKPAILRTSVDFTTVSQLAADELARRGS